METLHYLFIFDSQVYILIVDHTLKINVLVKIFDPEKIPSPQSALIVLKTNFRYVVEMLLLVTWFCGYISPVRKIYIFFISNSNFYFLNF